jgi:hypothetical protein
VKKSALFSASLLSTVFFFHFNLMAAANPAPTAESVKNLGANLSKDKPADVSVKGVDTETAEFAIGLGYQLCGNDPMPPLDMAFYCPSAEPDIQNVKVVMTAQKAAQPGWFFYEGSYTTTIENFHIKATVELSVQFSSADGKKYAYIDGRIINDHGKKPIYFRIAADDSFDNLGYLTYYGEQVSFKSGKDTLYFAPHLVIRKKIQPAPPVAIH